jgi:hypothetical protein
LELIDMFAHRRLERELRRREAALQEAKRAREESEIRPLLAQEPDPEPRPLVAPSMTRGHWECDFCGRSFHGYGSYLNHRCDRDD